MTNPQRETTGLADLIDGRHALGDPGWVDERRQTLDRDGALVIPGFLRPAVLAEVRSEFEHREHEAFYARSTHNVWLTPDDSTLEPGHVRNRQVVSTKGLLADDQIAHDSALKRLHRAPAFRGFLCSVLGIDAVHPYADRLSSVNVHFHRDGEELGWHFDNSSFAVTLLIQSPSSGGRFEYVPALRSADAGLERPDEVGRVLDGDRRPDVLAFEPGDLVLFRGRDAMHRVTPSAGPTTRILAVLAYNTVPGIALSDSAKETFYGRIA